MAKITMNLGIDDIRCYRLGNNLAIELTDGTLVTLTDEAMEELIESYEYILSSERAEREAEMYRINPPRPAQRYTTEELQSAIADAKEKRESVKAESEKVNDSKFWEGKAEKTKSRADYTDEEWKKFVDGLVADAKTESTFAEVVQKILDERYETEFDLESVLQRAFQEAFGSPQVFVIGVQKDKK